MNRCKPQDRRPSTLAGAALLAIALALAVAPSALASGTATATVAPIGPASASSYLVTVNNTGTDKITLLAITAANGFVAGQEGFVPSSIVPSECHAGQPIPGAIGCPGIAAGASEQVCYTGPPANGFAATFAESLPILGQATTAAAGVASCPLPGFNLPSGGGGGGSNEAGTKPGGVASISFGKAKANAKKGTATLSADVPGPGTLKLTGKGVKTFTATAKAAGAVSLTVKAIGKTAGKLAKNGNVKVKVSVLFTATGGATSTRSTTVKLIKH